MHSRLSARSLRRCTLALASALAAAGALLVTVPSVPAQASGGGISQCKAHRFCMWSNYNYNNNVPGTFWYRTYGKYTNYTWHYVGNNINDKATSVYNARSYKVGVNKDSPGSSVYRICWPGGYRNQNLNDPQHLLMWPQGGGKVNDSISSWWFSGTSSSCGPGF